MSEVLEKVKISELNQVVNYEGLFTIGTDFNNRSVKVPIEVLSKIGAITSLGTTNKTSLVAAINEVLSMVGSTGNGSNLSGYVVVPSVSDLPDPGQPTLGYLIGEDLYLYVGTGGDTLEGKYKDCGPFRGPAGPQFDCIIDISTRENNTLDFLFSNGEIITVDLNHIHNGMLPTVTVSDNGKIIKVVDGVWVKVDMPTIPDEQIQSDWSQSDNTKKDFIKNKPTIPDAQIQSDWNQTNNEAKDYIKNKPSIPAAQVNSDWNADSGVAQILNKPTIPTVPTISTDVSADANSDTKTASPKSVKTYVDSVLGDIETLLAAL